ncbi:MAG TPA: 3-deoxy-manno-octulosonate cytidylyltransferase [Pyrinomonadaceae bacterium]
MEQHGKNHRQKVFAVIPARYASTRLAGKLLLEIAGKPLILHTLERARKAENIDRVVVATDDERILEVVKNSGNEAVLTSREHQSGSDRLAEVAENFPENSIVVNVQGDEPTISPATIEKAVEAILADETVDIATTCEKIEEARDVLSPDAVKVVIDRNGFALYFSRLPVPFPREAVQKHGSLQTALESDPELLALFRKHTGLYVYRREYLLKFTKLAQTALEKTEMLEQLRALENGARIKVVEVAENSIGVDRPEDFERARQLIESRQDISNNFKYRPATIEDVPQIAKVHVDSWQKSFRGIAPQAFLDAMNVEKRAAAFAERFSDDDYRMFVAESDAGEIVGFVDFGKARHEVAGIGTELFAIYLNPELKGKGIGAELFKVGVRDLVARGIDSVYLQALKVSPYKKFYEKMGGKIVGEGIYPLGGEDFETYFYGWEDLSGVCRIG